MKITNITNESGKIPQEIRLPLLRKDGKSSNVILKEGEYCFIEHKGNNSILRLYETKRILKVTQEEPSLSQSYYKVYNNNSIIKKAKQAIKSVVKVFIKEEDVSIVEESHSISVEEESNEVLSKEVEKSIEIEVVVPEDSVKKKNKGGRPKGSKNKPKRGRPKSKNSKKKSKKNK
jgi:hypothetical protein